MSYKNALVMLALLLPLNVIGQNKLYRVSSSRVSFSSHAPLELINATSSRLQGVIDTARGQFAFKIYITSFNGFNNPLQREHFNENYMESSQFPVATYTGKIIEDIAYTAQKSYTVRTKGEMVIHGVSQERIIKAEIRVTKGHIKIAAHFSLLLSAYNIKIPRIVGNNLANEIQVTVTADLIPMSS